jgi:hypothetical protein
LNRVLLTGDPEMFDNTLYLHPPEPAHLNLVYLGEESASDPRQPLFFLQRALPSTRRQTVQLTARKPSEAVATELLAAAQLIVVTTPLPELLADAVRARLMAGQTVILAPAGVQSAPTLNRLLGGTELTLSEMHPGNYALFGELDFQHPLLSPFADPRFSDFTRIHFWRYRQLSTPLPASAHVAVRFDSGAPAWVDFPVGRGRLLFVASGWNPDDSQFALSTKFVPWLYALLDLAGASTTPVSQHLVGDPLPLPAGRTGSVSLQLPDGSIRQIPASATQFEATAQPGIYLLESGTGAKTYAVNLDPAESRTAPLGSEELERLGVRLDARLATVASQAPPVPTTPPAAESEGRQKLWRWFLLATLALLLIESLMAGRTARQLASPLEAGT